MDEFVMGEFGGFYEASLVMEPGVHGLSHRAWSVAVYCMVEVCEEPCSMSRVERHND